MAQERRKEADKHIDREARTMTKQNSMFILRGVKLLNAVVNILLFIACWKLFYEGNTAINKSLLLIGGYAVAFTWLSRIYHAYQIGSLRSLEILFSFSLASVITNVLTYLAIASISWRWKSPLPLIGLFGMQFLWNLIWSVAANRLYVKLFKPKRTIVIYRNDSDLEKLQGIRNLSSAYRVDKYIKNPTEIHYLLNEIGDHQVVFVAGIPATLRNGVAKYCVERDIELYAVPHVGDVIMAGAQHIQTYNIPVMRVLRAKPAPEFLFFKRFVDIVVSALAIIMLSPVMALTALAIKLQDGGPVIYRQRRLTKDGRVFEILKYRSMIVSAEKDGKARLASEHDDRITPVGRFIRACRIDELPQLLNILKGDMSIVGPRPERPEIAAQYEQEIPAFVLRLQVKAGLTGLAQVYGRYNTTPYDKLQMDLMYINRMSILEDIRLMFATVRILFMKESTEGIQSGASTAMNYASREESPEYESEAVGK